VYYFISDTHFGHEKIIEYCNRPFKDTIEMDETLIKNYNHYVRDCDIVYFLGDIGCGNQEYIKAVIERLKGIKILITGNHEKWGIMSYYDLGFVAVLEEAIITRGDYTFVLRHYPTRALSELIRLFWVYTKKMWYKDRSVKQIFQRLKREWRRYSKFSKDWVLHGHVHQAWLSKGKNINCSVEVWNYKPINIDEIINLIQKIERK
jgi:calcineurin-like phosphoesterase family protein